MDPFPVNVRTLDALHVATALIVAEDAGGVALFSTREGMTRCTMSLGLTAAFR